MSTRITKMPATELNNNNATPVDELPLEAMSYKRNRNSSIVSVSSASSCQSDSSEDVEGLSRKSSTQEVAQKDNNNEKFDFMRFRSMSDGATRRLSPDQQEPFEVFPSLPDSVLEKMGLLGSGPRERLNEEDLEQKFVALALAFTIDAVTIKDRCERQRRYRDQTETNLSVEIERLIQKANRIQPLCVDAETTELLSALLGQIDVVMRAASHATTSSERYGAVQHEERISESVNVMINHVNLLKQQRDSARRQLQYTKRVLQNSNTPESPSSPTTTKHISAIPNGRVITRRRASIAAITQPLETLKPSEARKISRRTSELSLRASSLSRNGRPSRLELGVDLTKIKEGMVEVEPISTEIIPETIHEPTDQSDNESTHNHDEVSSPEESQSAYFDDDIDLNSTELTLKSRLILRFRRFKNETKSKYAKWSNDGTISEICCFCALMCFSLSLIMLANVLIEVEYAKRGLRSSNLFWFWTSSVVGNNNHHLAKKVYQGSATTT